MKNKVNTGILIHLINQLVRFKRLTDDWTDIIRFLDFLQEFKKM